MHDLGAIQLFVQIVERGSFSAVARSLGVEPSSVSRQLTALEETLGGFITAATLGAFWLALGRLALSGDKATTVAFLTLALAQLWNVFNVRTGGGGFLRSDVAQNPCVWGAIAFCAGLLALSLAVPELALVLDLPNPGNEGLVLAFAMSLVPLALGQGLVALGVDARLARSSDGDSPGGRRRAA